MKFKDILFNLVNIYAPNLHEDQFDFIDKLYNITNNKKNIILGGDFNIDLSKKNAKNSRAGKKWINFLNVFNLMEIQDLSNSLINFTWKSGQNNSTIDKFFINSNQNISYSLFKNQINTLSDHNFIASSVSFCRSKEKFKYKKGNLWKLNEEVLENEYVDNYIKNKCKYIPNLIVNHDYFWYEFFIEDIIKMLKRESRRLNNLKKTKVNSLFYDLNVLYNQNDSSF